MHLLSTNYPLSDISWSSFAGTLLYEDTLLWSVIEKRAIEDIQGENYHSQHPEQD